MKKKRYTKEQMLSVYTAWQQSGLGKKAYCSQIGLATSTFFYWVKKFELKDDCYPMDCRPKASLAPAFRELDFFAKDDHVTPVLEIEYPSGTRLKFYKQPEANWIKTLL